MNDRAAKRALQRIALENGVSVAEVRQEIEAALAAGRSSDDPQVQARWAAIPCRGQQPTVEEVIIHLARQAKQTRAH